VSIPTAPVSFPSLRYFLNPSKRSWEECEKAKRGGDSLFPKAK